MSPTTKDITLDHMQQPPSSSSSAAAAAAVGIKDIRNGPTPTRPSSAGTLMSAAAADLRGPDNIVSSRHHNNTTTTTGEIFIFKDP